MEEAIVKELIEEKTLSTVQIALISGGVSLLTFLVAAVVKHYFENRMLKRKLETEHAFDQRKQIKTVLAKNKTHLLTACEDLNYRFWNYARTYKQNWLDVGGNYANEEYYFHSFCYRILAVYAWIKHIQKEMIFLDTTIATKKDLEFIKFLRVFPDVFVDLSLLVGEGADGSKAVDHFYKNKFEQYPDALMVQTGVQSYAEFIYDLGRHHTYFTDFFVYMDGISPMEKRKRWDRLHLMNLTVLLFLNNYGYDFQQTKDALLKEAITVPKTSVYLKTYFDLLGAYQLSENREVKRLQKIAREMGLI